MGEPRQSARLRWALVGLGRHADRFLAPGITAATSGELIAVCSRSQQTAEAFAARHGAPHAYSRLAEVLADPQVDAVLIASPNFAHAEQVREAASAGKHVLCEKPLATTSAACHELIECCASAGVKLGVGFHLRHNAVHVEARRLLRAGEIGELRLLDARYLHASAADQPGREPGWRADATLAGGGSFISTGVHIVDLARMLSGEEVHEVAASAGGGEVGAEELLYATGRLASGATLALCAGRIAYPRNELVLYGASGTIRAAGSVGNDGGGTLELITVAGASSVVLPPADVYKEQCEAFAASVFGGPDFEASGVDGLRCAEVIEAIYAAARTGARVAVQRAG